MLKARITLIFTIFFAVTALATSALAAPTVKCDVAALPTTSIVAPEARAEAQPLSQPVPEQKPGHITFSERSLTGEVSEAMLDLIKMMVPTRSTGFSFKDMQGKDQGKLILGVHLENKYTLELNYASDFRETNRFVLDKILLIDPSGKDEVLVKTPLKSDGTLRDGADIDLEDYPEFADRDFKMTIFSQIDAKIIDELERIGPRLEILDKDELRSLTKVKSYALVRSFLRARSAAKRLKKYIVQGPFKQAYSLTLGSAITLGVGWGLSIALPDQMKSFMEAMHMRSPKSHIVAEEKMPKQVRVEIRRLEKQIDSGGIAQIQYKTYPALVTYLEIKAQESSGEGKKAKGAESPVGTGAQDSASIK